jgi:predicted phage baseplate assembly protein
LFALSAPLDRQVLLDLARGEVRFGPAIHEPEGGWGRYGAVSPVGATMRLSRYRQGGGGAGNVASSALTILPVAIPRIASATNPRAATGGVDAESLDGARERARLIAQAKPAHVNYRLRVRAPSREQGSGA